MSSSAPVSEMPKTTSTAARPLRPTSTSSMPARSGSSASRQFRTVKPLWLRFADLLFAETSATLPGTSSSCITAWPASCHTTIDFVDLLDRSTTSVSYRHSAGTRNTARMLASIMCSVVMRSLFE